MGRKSCCSGRSNYVTSTTCGGNNSTPKKETVATSTITTPTPTPTPVKKEDAVNIVKP